MSMIGGFEMGYVGIILAACLADNGQDVLGLDINPAKLKMVNEGYSPIIEEEIGELVRKVVTLKECDWIFPATERIEPRKRQRSSSKCCTPTIWSF